MKRNEQGMWQKRYLCTVPHIFLYYFDSDTAEAPRGIIDLELYTSLSVEESMDSNILKLSSHNEEKCRWVYILAYFTYVT